MSAHQESRGYKDRQTEAALGQSQLCHLLADSGQCALSQASDFSSVKWGCWNYVPHGAVVRLKEAIAVRC